MGERKANAVTYRLVQIDGDRTFTLENSHIFGRESGLLTETMSRRHIQVVEKKGRWFVADLSSTNGTRLNGKPLREREWYPLTVRDTLTFGDLNFRLVQTVEEAAPAGEETAAAEENTTPDAGSVGEAVVAAPWMRFAASAIDYVCVSLAAGILQVMFAVVTPSLFLQNMTLPLSWFLIMIVPVALHGRTGGKKILGLWVVTKDGEFPGWRGTLLREVVGKMILMLMAPMIFAGILAALVRNNAPALIVPIVGLIVFGWLYRRHGEPFWDKLFKTQVTRYK